MPQRKIVCKYFILICSAGSIPCNSKTRKWPSQVFTNADEAHAHQVLNRLGLIECFDSIICFETLNPPNHTNVPTDNHVLAWSISLNKKDCNQVQSGCFNSKTQILCKPSVEAFEAAIQIANVDPRKTVQSITFVLFSIYVEKDIHNLSIYKSLLRHFNLYDMKLLMHERFNKKSKHNSCGNYAWVCLFIYFGRLVLESTYCTFFVPSSILCSCFLMTVSETLQVGKLLDLTRLL